MAIEIEKKFLLDAAAKERLINGAELLGTKVFMDTYFDNATYDLTRKDVWLRLREDAWELKIPLKSMGSIKERVADQYRELETEVEIAEYLHLPKDRPLTEVLSEAGYKSFASFTTTRTKYKKEGFGIDLDTIDFGYEIAEIELMVEDESKIEGATTLILEYAQKHDLRIGPVRGKLIEYVLRNDRRHFDILVESGAVLPENASL